MGGTTGIDRGTFEICGIGEMAATRGIDEIRRTRRVSPAYPASKPGSVGCTEGTRSRTGRGEVGRFREPG